VAQNGFYIRDLAPGLDDSPNWLVDIVAVQPSLPSPVQSRPAKSMHRRKSTRWVRGDYMLPEDFPDARIMRYCYEERIQLTGALSSIAGIARDFLTCLATARSDVPNHPLVFLGESLGALVIKMVCRC
jgi:hypothetical protein